MVNRLFNNPLRIEVGFEVILDAEHRNWCKVKVIYLSPDHMFAKVHRIEDDEETAWEVMTNRLSAEKL